MIRFLRLHSEELEARFVCSETSVEKMRDSRRLVSDSERGILETERAEGKDPRGSSPMSERERKGEEALFFSRRRSNTP